MTRLDHLLQVLASRSARQVSDATRREAAVALILMRDPDRFLLIERAQHVGDPWSGHLALPGGRREPGDADLLDTAIRESVEETGVELLREKCLATLDDLAPISPVLPPIIVRPFVFLLEAEPQLTLSREVAAAEWVLLSDLAREGWPEPREIVAGGRTITAPVYPLQSGLLWGMTERIVTPVVRVWVGER